MCEGGHRKGKEASSSTSDYLVVAAGICVDEDSETPSGLEMSGQDQ